MEHNEKKNTNTTQIDQNNDTLPKKDSSQVLQDDKLLDLRGSIKVCIRPKPEDVISVTKNPWYIDTNSMSIININDSTLFNFDHVFPADKHSTNKIVYDIVCADLVDSFLNKGFNSTIFAYGMTGLGKTFSMKGNPIDPGFVCLAIDEIFMKFNNENVFDSYGLSISYFEIYNEKIIDLLADGVIQSRDLKIRSNGEFRNQIVGLVNVPVVSKKQLFDLINKGDINRKISCTDYNSRSSRSHTILQINLVFYSPTDFGERYSTLSLCDLAGSERATSKRERTKEGSYINKSLLALSTVINKISLLSSTDVISSDHIPFRDSKLTRILQPVLSGSSLILILCTIHLSPGNTKITYNQLISETYNTLRFAARAKEINLEVTKKLEPKPSISKSLHKKIKPFEKPPDVFVDAKNKNDLFFENISQSEKNDVISSLKSEVFILNERLAHLTRIVDLQETELLIQKDNILNDIIDLKLDIPNYLIETLDNYLKKVLYKSNEQKSYIDHLENELKEVYKKKFTLHYDKLDQYLFKLNFSNERSLKHFDALVKEQQDEISDLKEKLIDKDYIIKCLSRTTKVQYFPSKKISISDDNI